MSPLLILFYFDIKARAEIIRICFAYGNVTYEDRRLTHEQFNALKPTFPLRQVPVLHIGDTVIAQSMAIARYASILSKIYPAEQLDIIRVESVLGCYDEVLSVAGDLISPKADPKTKPAKTKELVEERIPLIFNYIQNLVLGQFVLGNNISIADVAILCMVDYFLSLLEGFDVSKYPKIVSIIRNVKAKPTIAAYLKAHP
uniref:Glutathione Stransferase putative n=1 Tax=Albugo laibachii Nc14 TaxID=890382 RepID=F0W597_9STRA|nr:glutathione Stransferase putative [Albugo laibachii Nc14]|eukprot:CCA16288.1 glutathione Stransferase putative [Albugo laibachii Nc14]